MKYINARTNYILNQIKSEGVHSNKQNFNSDNIRDLIQQAEMLTLDAIDRFNGDVNNESFYKYAKKYILGGLVAFVLNQGDISIPAASRYEYNRILTIKKELEKLGRKVTQAELAEAASASLVTVKMAFRVAPLLDPAQRLDIKISNDKTNKATELIELIPQDSIGQTEDILFKEETVETVQKAISLLPIVEQKVIRLMMDGKKVHEIAKEAGIPAYMVSKVRTSAFRRLRNNEQLKALKETLQAA